MIFCITDIYLKEKMYKPMLILHFVNVDYQESIAFQNSFFAHISILFKPIRRCVDIFVR